MIKALNRKLNGYYNYYAITDNGRSIQKMRHYIMRTLYKALKRRSNRHKLSWESYEKILKNYILIPARIKINIYNIQKTIELDKL